MKLKGKFLIPTLLIVVISIATFGIINYINSRNIIFNQLYTEAERQLDTMISMINENYLDIQSSIEKFKVGDSGYAYLVNDKGKIIAHPQDKEEGKNISDYDWGKYILSQKQGTKIYKYGGFQKYTVFKKIGNNTAIIAVPYDEFINPLNALKRDTVIVVIVSIILISLLINVLISKTVIKPINLFIDKMQKAKEGDLTANIKVNSKDEFQALADNYNGMLDNIRKLVTNAADIAGKSEVTVESITSAVEEVSVSSEEISNSVQEIAIGSNSQAEESNRTLEASNMLAENISVITAKLAETIEDAKEMKEKDELGMSSVTHLEEKFNSYLNISDKLSSNIFELSEKSKSIESIVRAIDSISEQTNLLALNAAIEAARAGEYGRGFSVVAEEIRKLAEQSQNSTKEVQNIIDQITQKIDSTNEITDTSKQLVEEVDSSIENVRDVFENIKLIVDRVVDKIDELNQNVKYIDASKNDVIKAIENISTISQQSAASTEEISASAQQQTASMEEVASSMQELSLMINDLSKAIEIFKI